jgi:tRNA uridine 5-carboxymethylaminomethyl modification enzyme
MWNIPDPLYDVAVIGGGHAGIEAALACARLGLRTSLITMSVGTIGQMSCNPAIGGLGKGHLVRELDALGGEMATAIDECGIQFRMLNLSKGPAVWSPRAQADKNLYASRMQRRLFETPGLDLRQDQVVDLALREGRVEAVILSGGTRLRCGAAIVCSGTFLNGRIHLGEAQTPSGRAGEPPAIGLSEALTRLGVAVQRFKTGTPPRLDADSIDWSRLEEQVGDAPPRPFRFYENRIARPQHSCHLAWTHPGTHAILRANLQRSPMYSGQISAVGPRYCPSVEDKVVRFADKDRHPLFLEPEGEGTREIYINGFSTSMPEPVQLEALRSVAGLEQARFIRPGYAIEYDYFPAWQIDHRLAFRGVENLFLAGQVNGTSGYEEAAMQGLLAAINAAALLAGGDGLVLGRDEAYAGVLIDDLVTRPTEEPYRMFTSRAEFRLLLRQDNADRRLMPIGRRLGLLEDWRWREHLRRKELRLELEAWLQATSLPVDGVLRRAAGDPDRSPGGDGSFPPDAAAGSEMPLPSGERLRAAKLLKRPGLRLTHLLDEGWPAWRERFDEDLCTGVEFDGKYEGYVQRQRSAVANFRRQEDQTLPETLDYRHLGSLSLEGRERLAQVRPRNLGQAARLGGVSAADLSALWIHLQKLRRESRT